MLGWVVFAALVLYAVFLGGTFAGIYLAVVRWWSLVLVAAGLAIWAILAVRDPSWRPRSAIWPALVLPLLVLAVTTATSPYPRLGIEYVAWSTLLAALYLLLVRILARPFIRARIGALLGALCLGIGLTYAVLVLRDWIDWWGLVGRVTAPPLRPEFEGLTYGNPSAVLTVVVLCLLPALAALPGSGRARAAMGTLLVVVTAIVVVMTGSRAGWLAIGIAIVVVGAAWLLMPGHRGRLGEALADRRARPAIVAAVAIVAVVGLLLVPSLVLRAGNTSDGGRLQYFTTALRMFADHPLLGVGPGVWVALRIVYTQAGELDYTVPHAHDLYLQGLAETGLLGAIAGIVALACVAWLVIGAIRGRDDARRRWAWAAAGGLVYLAAHSTLDVYANMPAVILVAALPVAWLDASSTADVPIPRAVARPLAALRPVATPAFVTAAVLAVAVLFRAESIAGPAQTAVDRIDAGDWAAALPLAESAAADDPDIPAYRVTAGLAREAAGDWAGAAADLGAAVAVDDLPQTWLAIAWAADEGGAPRAEVAADLARATRTGIQQPAVAFAAGWLSDRIGDASPADDAYVGALTGLPSLAADPYWTTDPAVAPRWADLLTQAIAADPTDGWELALMAGDADTARALLDGAPDPALADLVIRAWGGDADAAEAVRETAEARPLDGDAVAWAARVSAHQGDAEQAARFRAWADEIESSSFEGYEVRIETGRLAERDNAGSGVRFYGAYTYRRPTPNDLVAAGLPRLVYVDEAAAP